MSDWMPISSSRTDLSSWTMCLIQPPPDKVFAKILVPTVDTVRSTWLLDTLVQVRHLELRRPSVRSNARDNFNKWGRYQQAIWSMTIYWNDQSFLLALVCIALIVFAQDNVFFSIFWCSTLLVCLKNTGNMARLLLAEDMIAVHAVTDGKLEWNFLLL